MVLKTQSNIKKSDMDYIKNVIDLIPLPFRFTEHLINE